MNVNSLSDYRNKDALMTQKYQEMGTNILFTVRDILRL
jgi:hypothetical protein